MAWKKLIRTAQFKPNNITTMKSRALVCLSAILLFTAAANTRAGDQDFTLVNKTGVEIHNLHVSPSDKEEWGEDILGKDTLGDEETAEIAVEAALTGHQVLSTMHCNDAAGAIARLDDMGIAPFLISSSVILACAQRLLRDTSLKLEVVASESGFGSAAHLCDVFFEVYKINPTIWRQQAKNK